MEKNCDNCTKGKGVELPCTHLTCTECLIFHCKSIFEINPRNQILCQMCASPIPLPILYEVFNGITEFYLFQNGFEKESCPLCMGSFFLNQCTMLNCDHLFCNTCLENYFNYLIDSAEFTGNGLPCPNCSQIIENSVIQHFVGENIYKNYLDLITVKNKSIVIEKQTMRWCLCCDKCCVTGENQEEFYCSRCKKTFCIRCKQEQCEKNCEYFEKDEDLERENRILNDQSYAETLIGLENSYIQCPKCRNSVDKVRGCNFIRCPWPECDRTFFCTLCYKILDVIFK